MTQYGNPDLNKYQQANAESTLKRLNEALNHHHLGAEAEKPLQTSDAINPSHYRSHPSGVEAIQITEHLNFCIGNAMKYLWRAGLKGDAVEDLNKAKWYIEREIARIGGDHD